MAKTVTMSRVLGFRDFFPNETPESLDYYGHKIGSEWLQRFCCYYLGFFRNDDIPSIEELIKSWFTYTDLNYSQNPSYWIVEESYRRIRNFHPAEEHEIIIPESLLNMFQWTINNRTIPISIPINVPRAMYAFKLYLLFNEKVLLNYQKAIDSIPTILDGRQGARTLLATSFPQFDLINIDYAQLFYTQYYKALLLLEFLEKNINYNLLLNKLLQNFNVRSKEEYLKGLTDIIMPLFKIQKSGWSVMRFSEEEYQSKLLAFLESLTTPSDMANTEQDDYLTLRDKPFQQTSDQEYRVIFDLFLIKKVYTGLIFKLSEIDKKDKSLFSQNFLGKLRDNFSEGVLVYEIMKSIFESRITQRYTGEEFKIAGLKREPDYFVRSDNDIILIESKDFFIKGEVKLSYDFNLIESALKFDNDGKPDRLGKAVIQLSENIKRTFLLELLLDTAYNPKEIKIYPVIIVHDSLYGAIALNFWVNYWMNDELDIIKGKNPELTTFDFSNVFPLTIIEIDSLILFENNFKSMELDLVELIKLYHEHVNFQRKNVTDIKTLSYNSGISFSEFIRDYGYDKKVNVDVKQLIKRLTKFMPSK